MEKEIKKLTSEELNKVREYLIWSVMRNPDVMFNDDIRGDSETINTPDMVSIIVGLYELLHIEVTGESYDYMWHWANKIGSWVETKTDFFKE